MRMCCSWLALVSGDHGHHIGAVHLSAFVVIQPSNQVEAPSVLNRQKEPIVKSPMSYKCPATGHSTRSKTERKELPNSSFCRPFMPEEGALGLNLYLQRDRCPDLASRLLLT